MLEGANSTWGEGGGPRVPSSRCKPIYYGLAIVLQVMDRDSIQSIAVKFETTPSEIARINKKQTLTFSIFPGDVSC